MTTWEQKPTDWEDAPFEVAEFAENPEPRCPCVLLLDVSSSMRGDKIQQLNEGLSLFGQSLLLDDLAAKRVEIALVTFGLGISRVCDFCTPDQLHMPILEASGNTPMGSGALKAIEMIEERKKIYRANGISYYRPWIFMISDGEPTDHEVWQRSIDEIRTGEEQKKFMFFAVAVEGANLDKMRRMTIRAPLPLRNLEFGSLFQWLSNSLAAVSHSQINDRVQLPPPGWAETS